MTKDYKAIRSVLVTLFTAKFILSLKKIIIIFIASLDHIVKCEPKNSKAKISFFFLQNLPQIQKEKSLFYMPIKILLKSYIFLQYSEVTLFFLLFHFYLKRLDAYLKRDMQRTWNFSLAVCVFGNSFLIEGLSIFIWFSL